VAGNLANGVSPKRLGPGIGDYNRGHVSRPEPIENGLAGSVLYIDGFGNLMTNLNNTELDGVVKAVMIFQGTELRFVSSYYEGDPGEPVVLRGSAGFLEIAVNGGNAAEMLHAKVGTSVRLFWSQY
jgi:S-adenosylmethionine hydrolase